MKKLSGAFTKNDNRKKSTALTKKRVVDVESTTPRKINESDYEIIRRYAFENKLTMLEATENIYEEMKKLYSSEKENLRSIDLEEYTSPNQKSIRISIDFNDYLKEKTNEIRVPSKFILSYFIKHLKDELV